MTLTIECLRCDQTYTQYKRRASHFCPDCRAENNRENTRERMSRLRQEIREAGEDLRTRLGEATFPTLDEYTEAVADEIDDRPALVPDRMPAGANAPAGPDEGHSTFFRDLGEHLDAHRKKVAYHAWWRANPHWSYELHNPEKAAKFLLTAAV